MLKEYLKSKEVSTLCIIRGNNDEAARERLFNCVKRYGINLNETERQRIRVLAGDLSEPRCGISEQVWLNLSLSVTDIVHCGANVNFFENYYRIRKANVESTRELIKFCSTGRLKKLFYISTMGVLHGTHHINLPVLSETFATGTPEGLPTGYQQSKWVSEKLISRAVERGLNAQIIRLGTVATSLNTGALNEADMFVHLLSSVNKIGTAPEMRDVDFLPVEFVAQSIACISKTAQTSGHVYHLTNPNTLPIGKFSAWAKLAGTRLKISPFEQWRDDFVDYLAKTPEDPFAIYSPLLLAHAGSMSFVEILLKAPNVDTTQTRKLLETQGIEYPEITPDMMRFYDNSFRPSWAVT